MTGARALAAIDVGTNSVHMVIARPVPGGSPEILARERVPVRLGTGGDDMKLLMPDAIERAVDALVEFRHIADAHDADVVAVATSAVREADNQGRFLRRVHDEARITVEIGFGHGGGPADPPGRHERGADRRPASHRHRHRPVAPPS